QRRDDSVSPSRQSKDIIMSTRTVAPRQPLSDNQPSPADNQHLDPVKVVPDPPLLGGVEGAAPEEQTGRQEVPGLRAMEIIRAINQLGHTLHACSMYDAKQPEDLRKVMANILIKVIDLIMELYPDHPEWAIPLNQLLFSLKDLDRGKPNSLFKAFK